MSVPGPSPLHRLPARILPGFILREPLVQTQEQIVYRARRRSDGEPVLVKLSTAERPPQRWLETLRREFDLSQAFALPNALRPLQWLDDKQGPGLVIEASDGLPLSALELPLEPAAFFPLAEALAAAVSTLHDQHVTHCALRPEHCFWDPARARMDLTGFGHARLDQAAAPEPAFEPEALPFLAPEQTGRMGYDVDGRADLYALGCLFYLLLTGQPPFTGADTAEYIHAHIARRPRPPTQLNAHCPPGLERVVLKLLAKTPDERYQSGQALLTDLQRCQREWAGALAALPWEPGDEDRRRQFRLPLALFGRDQELARLLEAFRRVQGGVSQTVLLAGQAGVGKTSLVQLLRERRDQDARFVQGKFERLRRHSPYSALIGAFGDLVRQLLTESEERLRYWRQALHQALGGQLRVIVEVIPELALVVGECPPVAEVSPAEAHQRFEGALRGFMEVMAGGEQPLVVFLDDLQWADTGSLRLLQHLTTDWRLGRLLLIGAYRDNELSPVHPLAPLLEGLAGKENRQLISLHPLEPAAVNLLVAETLQRPPEQTRPLALWLHQRTQGNPFFLRQLLATLRERGVIRFDAEAGRWDWQLDSPEATALASDVVDFITQRIRRLPQRIQDWLPLAACLGGTLHPGLLAAVCGLAEDQLREDMELARTALLLVPADPGGWRFAHDRVQQAAYALLPPGSAPAAHLRIGRLLLRRLPEAELDQHVFELTNQFNRALGLLKTAAERRRVAELNLRAGGRAKAAAAFEAARRHLATGLSLLSRRRWSGSYALCYRLTLELAECEYVLGNHEAAADLFDEVIAHGREPADQAQAYLSKIVLATSSDNPAQALDLGARCLALFGVDLPLNRDALTSAIAVELERVQTRMAAPPAARPELSAYVPLTLARISTAAYQTGLHMFVLVILKLVNSALAHGDPRIGAFAYINYAVILGSFLGDYRRAEEFAATALELGERLGDEGLKARLAHVYGSAINHWTQPAAQGIQQLQRAHRHAVEAADPLFSSLAISFLFRSRIIAGDRLDALLDDWEQFQPAVEQARFRSVSLPFRLARQWALALKGKTDSPTCLSDGQFDEAAALETFQASPVKSPLHWYCVLKAILCYWFGEQEAAWTWIREADRHIESAFGQLAVPEHLFFEGLILAARLPALADAEEREVALTVLEARLQRLSRWAELAPDNFLARARLLAGELARLRDQPQAAMEAYEEAVQAARRGGAPQILALAHELAGRFYLGRGFEAMARAHLAEAHYGYLMWGAAAKAQQLAAALPQLIPGALHSVLHPVQEGEPALDPADVATITKAAQAITGTLDLRQLLARLLGFAMEHAGAERAILLLQRGEELYLEGEAQAGHDFHGLNQSLPLERFGRCAWSAVNFVRRTRRTLVLADAGADRAFMGDPWVREHGSRSLLCMPIVRHRKPLGLLYLENNLIPYAFTPKRLALLEVLVSQVAISLENALLYDNLMQEIRERERAETSVRESERRWRAFLDNAQLAVVSLDLEGRIEYVNPYLQELSGYPREELIGRNWFELLVPARYQRRELQQHFHDQLRDRSHASLRGALATRGGEERRLRWSSAWLRDTEGQVVGTVSLGEDITERLQAEREIRRLHRELENQVQQRTHELLAANAELEAFAYSVSHDLRAPLRAIDGFSQALLEDSGKALDKQGRDYLRRVRSASQRMGGLIDALLQMSRVTRGVLEQERVNLSRLARDLGEELAGRYPGHEVGLRVEPGLVAEGDPRLLRQVLDNLLDNAWKYTRRTATPQVAFGQTTIEGRRVFCVSDNGVGFDMRYAGRLFDAFQRLHPDQEFEGTGVGLATVSRIIRRHGGEIWAESEVGQGSRFYFTLAG